MSFLFLLCSTLRCWKCGLVLYNTIMMEITVDWPVYERWNALFYIFTESIQFSQTAYGIWKGTQSVSSTHCVIWVTLSVSVTNGFQRSTFQWNGTPVFWWLSAVGNSPLQFLDFLIWQTVPLQSYLIMVCGGNTSWWLREPQLVLITITIIMSMPTCLKSYLWPVTISHFHYAIHVI